MTTTSINKVCKQCGCDYRDIPSRRVYFCSKKCWAYSVASKKEFICQYCHQKYVTGPTRNIKYCNRACYRESLKGVRRPRIVGERISKAKLHGREPANIRVIRKTAKYYRTREIVLNRDKNVCQICGERGNILHHIYKAFMHKDKIFNPDNGITLCGWCHDHRVSKHEGDWVSYFNFNLETREVLNSGFN